MNFLNRLKFYLIGVALGILMVMAIFKDRKLTSWTPQNQVVEELTTKPYQLNDEIRCLLSCAGIKDSAEVRSLLESADVNFSESDVEDIDNRLYELSFDNDKVKSMKVRIQDTHLTLEHMVVKVSDCPCWY